MRVQVLTTTATLEARLTPARAALLDRIDALAAALADGDISVARVAALDELLTTGLVVAGTTAVAVIRPSLATQLTVTASATAWTLGAWAEIAAANDLVAHALVAVMIARASGGNLYQIEFGTGAAGAETVVGRVPATPNTTGGEPYLPIVPPIQITANARVAARVASDGVSATIGIYALFLPRPF